MSVSLLIATGLIAVFGWAFACWTKPRTLAAWIAAFVVSSASAIVVISETVGRVRYTPATLLGSAVLAAALAIALLSRLPREERRGPFRFDLRRRLFVALRGGPLRVAWLCWLACALYSLVAVGLLGPDVPDVLRYHMAAVVGWFQMQRVGIVPEMDFRASYFPHAMELLSGWCFLLGGGDRFSALPHLVFAAVLWPVTCYIGFRICGARRDRALFASILASLVGPVVVQMRSEMVDVGYFAAFLLGLFTAVGGRRLYERPTAVASVAAGFALAAKVSGIIGIGVIYLALLVRAVGEGQLGTPRRLLANLGGAVLGSLLIGGWVYGLNFWKWGNPTYPFALSLFGLDFPGPPDTESVAARLVFNLPPIDAWTNATFMISRWPALLLGLPPFARPMAAGNSGFGWSFTALLVVTCVLMALALARRLRGGRRPLASGRSRTALGMIVALLAIWSVLFAAVGGTLTVYYPLTAVDARYQLHLVWLTALGFLLFSGAMPSRGFRVAAYLVAVVTMVSFKQSIYEAPHRGYPRFAAAVRHGVSSPSTYPRTTYSLKRLLDAIGPNEPLLAANTRGHLYPLFLPNYSRRVFMIDPCGGPSDQTSELPDLGPDLARQVVTSVRSIRAQLRGIQRGPNSPLVERDPSKTVCASDYELALAAAYGVEYLFSAGGRSKRIEARKRWELVYEDRASTRKSSALYRLVSR